MTGFARWRAGYFATAPTSPGKPTSDLKELAAAELESSGSPMLAARAERFSRRLQDGHRLFAMTDGGRVAAYLWASAPGQETPLGLGVSFIVPDGMIYVWDCRTEPERQGRGFYRRGLEALRRRFAERCGGCLIAVEENNAAAIRAMRAAGFHDRSLRYSLARLGPLGVYAKDGFPRPFLHTFRDDRLLTRRT
jgi:ribosomal protein S18 acetylase RimI-like enzyme